MRYETAKVEEREWRFKDKSNWMRGEWDDEADKVQWTDEETGLPCLIVRSSLGALCGYVGVPTSHPWFGLDYEDCTLSECPDKQCSHDVDSELEAHGGITFSGPCFPHRDNPEEGICHIVPGDEKIWWFGFDCSHSGDMTPNGYLGDSLKIFSERFMDILTNVSGGVYRHVSYVRSEVSDLARQLGCVVENEAS